jgi:MFS family permease
VRSFRFQWPADLLTSWAFEMETLILGWYVLVKTESVVWLTVFASLQFLGTLIAPMIGVVGDRVGRRAVLCAMRSCYVLFASVIMVLSLSDILSPVHVFAVALCSGLVRPSDLVMRNALIGDTIPFDHLTNAVGVSRTTMDSARIAGALVGAGLFSQLGLGNAYVVVVAVYGTSLLLTLGVSRVKPSAATDEGDDAGAVTPRRSPWRDLRQGFAYVRTTPLVLALMLLAFLVNFTAFPISNGLLPYVAREIYQVDENGLSHLVATFAAGALLGSLVMAFVGRWRRPGKLMFGGIWIWYGLLLLFAQMHTQMSGLLVLLFIGLSQSMGMIAMSVTLISNVESAFRGRIMGVRMLAVYGLPLGLFASSWLISALGFALTASIYACIGLVASGLIAFKWRERIWH